MRIILPTMKPIPENATKEDRQKMYDEYYAELKQRNPHCFNADGTKKTIWQWIKRLFFIRKEK